MKPDPTPLLVAFADRPPGSLIVVWIVTTAGLSDATTDVTEPVVATVRMAAVEVLALAAVPDATGRGTRAIVAPDASAAERIAAPSIRPTSRCCLRGGGSGAVAAGRSFGSNI